MRRRKVPQQWSRETWQNNKTGVNNNAWMNSETPTEQQIIDKQPHT
jgi:hypothetical protein